MVPTDCADVRSTDMPADVVQAPGPGPDTHAVTGADTVRTYPDSGADFNPEGVRFEYRATAPRHLAGAALAEAVTELHRHLADQ
jgi:hypothetical protein